MDYYNRPHLLNCNYSQKLGSDKYPLEYIRENNYLTLPNLKEVIFFHRLLCGNNILGLDHQKLYGYRLHELPLTLYSDPNDSMSLHGYIPSSLYDILEVEKR